MPWKDPEKHKKYLRDRYAADPEKWRAKQREYTHSRPGKCAEYTRKYRERTNYGTLFDARQREHLSDRYVRGVLSARTHISTSCWPQELVEAKRAELKLRRELNGYNRKTKQSDAGSRQPVSDVR